MIALVSLAPWVFAFQATVRTPPLRFACDSAGIPPTASRTTLSNRFGAVNVRVARIELGEGFSAPGLVLFPLDARRRVEITWYDTVGERLPNLVRLDGDTSEWVHPTGITLGTRLAELERRNAKPFRIAGFGFDGAGTVIDWAGGRLVGTSGQDCEFRVALHPQVTTPEEQRLVGKLARDTAFSSALPAMRAVHPRVNRLWLSYPEPKRR